MTTIQQWCEKHGDYVSWGGIHLFEDGATRENQAGVWGKDPSPDPHERARMVLQYRRVKLAAAVEDFDECRQALVFGARLTQRQSHPGSPPTEALEGLKALQAEVTRWRSAVEEAEEAVEASTPEGIISRRALDDKNRAAIGEFVEAVKAITA